MLNSQCDILMALLGNGDTSLTPVDTIWQIAARHISMLYKARIR